MLLQAGYVRASVTLIAIPVCSKFLPPSPAMPLCVLIYHQNKDIAKPEGVGEASA